MAFQLTALFTCLPYELQRVYTLYYIMFTDIMCTPLPCVCPVILVRQRRPNRWPLQATNGVTPKNRWWPVGHMLAGEQPNIIWRCLLFSGKSFRRDTQISYLVITWNVSRCNKINIGYHVPLFFFWCRSKTLPLCYYHSIILRAQ